MRGSPAMVQRHFHAARLSVVNGLVAIIELRLPS